MFPRVISSCLLIALVALLSSWSQGEDPQVGVLRLNWKTVGEKIRIETAGSADDVPTHMRPQQDFEERIRDYRLTVTIDGKPWLDQVMRPPGLHGDRPISVFEEINLPPGRYQVKLQFWPVQTEDAQWKPEIDRSVLIEKGSITSLTVVPDGEPN